MIEGIAKDTLPWPRTQMGSTPMFEESTNENNEGLVARMVEEK